MKKFIIKLGKSVFLQITAFSIIVGGVAFAAIVWPNGAPSGESTGGKFQTNFNKIFGAATFSGTNVGIGTNNPTAKLEVNGNIIANNPTAGNQVATKDYVDNKVASIPAGTTGATGSQGPKGDKGDTGATGPQGQAGIVSGSINVYDCGKSAIYLISSDSGGFPGDKYYNEFMDPAFYTCGGLSSINTCIVYTSKFSGGSNSGRTYYYKNTYNCKYIGKLIP